MHIFRKMIMTILEEIEEYNVSDDDYYIEISKEQLNKILNVRGLK